MTSFNASVARVVRAVRESGDLSQEELARRVGVTRATIANIENKRQGISLELFLRISDASVSELTDLISGDMVQAARAEIPPILPDDLPEQDRQRVHDVLRDLIT